MATPEIEEFAALLVEHVRDAAIQSCDLNLHPAASSVVAKRWRAARASEGVSVTIPDCIDSAIFFLLHAIDEGLLPLRFVSKTGKVIDLQREGSGELAGLYMATNSWRGTHSKERFVDDFADLDPS